MKDINPLEPDIDNILKYFNIEDEAGSEGEQENSQEEGAQEGQEAKDLEEEKKGSEDEALEEIQDLENFDGSGEDSEIPIEIEEDENLDNTFDRI
mmetsp:Transcript_28465/g.25308  ORF Transcript_28465/g.25308 Transcript_28465/m.25308 type:complete len:95 (+) Transcript_28465:1233-1517(+)